jgi:hypothetical protein
VCPANGLSAQALASVRVLGANQHGAHLGARISQHIHGAASIRHVNRVHRDPQHHIGDTSERLTSPAPEYCRPSTDIARSVGTCGMAVRRENGRSGVTGRMVELSILTMSLHAWAKLIVACVLRERSRSRSAVTNREA